MASESYALDRFIFITRQPASEHDVSILRRIILLCQQIPKGITDQVIQNDMPQFDAQQRVMAINRLLSTVRNHILSGDPSFPTFS